MNKIKINQKSYAENAIKLNTPKIFKYLKKENNNNNKQTNKSLNYNWLAWKCYYTNNGFYLGDVDISLKNYMRFS